MIKALIRVIERDMAPTLFIFFFIIVNGSLFVFGCLLFFVFLVCSAVMSIAYAKQNYTLIMTMRVAIFVLTILAFFNLFVDDMHFTDITYKID